MLDKDVGGIIGLNSGRRNERGVRLHVSFGGLLSAHFYRNQRTGRPAATIDRQRSVDGFQLPGDRFGVKYISAIARVDREVSLPFREARMHLLGHGSIDLPAQLAGVTAAGRKKATKNENSVETAAYEEALFCAYNIGGPLSHVNASYSHG